MTAASSSPLSPRSVLLVKTICLVVLAYHASRWFRISPWDLGGDMDAYWQAAIRLREGSELFPPLSDLDAHNVYRYSPWFAAAWIPLTYMPHGAVEIAWTACLLLAAAALLRPLVRLTFPSIALLLLIGVPLVESAWYGQVQPLMVLGIQSALRRPAGPVMIGLAASLKATPIAFALVYAIRRQWGRCVLSFVVAIGLAAPTLWFDLSHYPFDAGVTVSLWTVTPALWLAFAATTVAAALRFAVIRPQWAVLAAGVAAIALSPRVYLDMVSYLLPAVSRTSRW